MFGVNRPIAGVLGSRGGSVLARRFPGQVFNFLHRWPKGLKQLDSSAFVLSFDCETERDIEILPKLLQQLHDARVVASFAVIGALAERFPHEHRAIAEGGHEIFNHGYSEHTSIADDGSHTSTILYNNLTELQIQDEIEKGAGVIEEFCGVIPIGFRAPHFGTLTVASGDVGRLHRAIVKSGTRYSSSMSDLEVLRLSRGGDSKILEFPLASHPDRPAAVLDSWSTVASFGDGYVAGSLRTPVVLLMRRLAAAKSPRFASIYLDPVQVVDLPEFVELLNAMSEADGDVKVVRYCDLLE